ncbi:MAG: hypothetical protein KAT27_06295, partial [Desulfobacterales bacterium]|nr:hypothetical protein [Desulfobacterales bacterium]
RPPALQHRRKDRPLIGVRGSKAARIVQRLRFLNNAKYKHVVFTSNVPLPPHLIFSDTQYVMEPLP